MTLHWSPAHLTYSRHGHAALSWAGNAYEVRMWTRHADGYFTAQVRGHPDLSWDDFTIRDGVMTVDGNAHDIRRWHADAALGIANWETCAIGAAAPDPWMEGFAERVTRRVSG